MDAVVLLGCGDVGPIHGPIEGYGSFVRETLVTADIRLAQVERVYSERGVLEPHSGGGHSRLSPAMASVFTDCGFNVASVASNHAMDWGAEALLDTIDLLRGRGIQTIGGGRNLAEARQPAMIACKGLRVALLAYCSILHEGYAAGPNKAGVAPLRAHTRYEVALGCISAVWSSPAHLLTTNKDRCWEDWSQAIILTRIRTIAQKRSPVLKQHTWPVAASPLLTHRLGVARYPRRGYTGIACH